MLSVLYIIVARVILTPGLCAAVLSALYSRARVILTPGHLFFELKGSLSTTPSYTLHREGWEAVRYIDCDRGEIEGRKKETNRKKQEKSSSYQHCIFTYR
jgi:hypothetical protein